MRDQPLEIERRRFLSLQGRTRPARFDDTEIPGLPSTTGYIDLRQTTPEQLAELIKQKLSE